MSIRAILVRGGEINPPDTHAERGDHIAAVFAAAAEQHDEQQERSQHRQAVAEVFVLPDAQVGKEEQHHGGHDDRNRTPNR